MSQSPGRPGRTGSAHSPTVEMSPAQAAEVEPFSGASAALHVAETGVVDPRGVRAAGRDVVELWREVRTSCQVTAMAHGPRRSTRDDDLREIRPDGW